MQLALFDLDNTLLPIDSDHQWGEFLVRLGVVDGDHYRRRNDEFYRQYQDGTLDMLEYLAFQLAPLATRSPEELADWHRRFMREVIEPAMRPSARALVERHLRQGDLCAVVTATNEFVTAPIACAFGIDALIATGLESIDGRLTGRPRGTPCFREGKIENTERWLGSLGHRWHDFERSWFYSDSANDLPLLARVSDPVATNPDQRLAAHARAQGWPILQLFE